jgi:hypothetical protein
MRIQISGRDVDARTFTIDQLDEADENQEGFCISCGEVHECCEPDAAEYECDVCGEKLVFGAAEIALMGLIT